MNSEQASVWRLTGSPCEHAIILHSDTNVALSIALLFQVKGFAAEVACDYVDALERSGGRSTAFLVDVSLNKLVPGGIVTTLRAGIRHPDSLVLAITSPLGTYSEQALADLHYDGTCGSLLNCKDLVGALKRFPADSSLLSSSLPQVSSSAMGSEALR
jgi:hypothetical protein